MCSRKNSDSHALFVYGTLKDAEMRRALFRGEIACQEAVLPDYVLRADGGFFFVRPEQGSKVSGLILQLSEAQLLLADQWEEVPLYSRIKATALAGGRSAEVWVYARFGLSGKPADGLAVSSLSRDVVLGMITQFHGATLTAGTGQLSPSPKD